MSKPTVDALISRCDSLRRGHTRIRDAEMRRRGSLEHEILLHSIKLAGLRSLARERAAEAARNRDWSRLERLVSAVSAVVAFAIALVASYLSWRLLVGSLQG